MTPEQFGQLMAITAKKYESTYEDLGRLLKETLKEEFSEINQKLEQEKCILF